MRVAFVALLIVGCAGVESTSEVASEVASEIGGTCPTCSNSPVVESYHFHDLDRFGAPNAQGLRVLGYRLNGNPVALDVKNGRFVATDSTTVYTKAMLKDLEIWIASADARFSIKIDAVGTSQYWAELGGGHPSLEVYTLSWAKWSGSTPPRWPSLFQPVCPEPVNPNDSLGLAEGWATVFEGDRIDGKLYTVYDYNDRWFNIGCAGHLIAKLALTGHTEAAKSVGFVTTRDERQTMVKMFAADYCGIGMPFTQPGQPLTWQDDHGWMTLVTYTSFEAKWGPSGALCLNTPRYAAYSDVMAVCSRPVCPSTLPAHLITANP